MLCAGMGELTFRLLLKMTVEQRLTILYYYLSQLYQIRETVVGDDM